jgi:hypothetical protein
LVNGSTVTLTPATTAQIRFVLFKNSDRFRESGIRLVELGFLHALMENLIAFFCSQIHIADGAN